MKVLVFEIRCRPHDVAETVKVNGASTLKNIDLGYDRVAERMVDRDCDDYSVTYAVTRDDNVRPALKPHSEIS